MDEPEARFSGRIGGGGGGRWIAGAVIAVVATVGFAVLGRGIPPPAPSTAPTTSAAASPPPPPSATVSADCDPLPPDSPVPLLRLGSATHEVGVHGLVGTTHRPGHEEPDRGWQVPGPELTLELRPLEAARLVLGSGDCLRALRVDAAPADLGRVPGPGEVTEVVARAYDPPTPSVRLDLNARLDRAAGDWVVRIRAEYWTGPEVGPDHDMWAEQYFRIRILDRDPTPPRPRVTPTVPCKFFVAEGGVGARLLVPDASPVYGPPDVAEAPTVLVSSATPLVIALDGDGCAIEWVIEFVDVALIESVGNATGDPNDVSQNRWSVGGPPPGESVLHIRYRSSATAAWLEAWWRLSSPGD